MYLCNQGTFHDMNDVMFSQIGILMAFPLYGSGPFIAGLFIAFSQFHVIHFLSQTILFLS